MKKLLSVLLLGLWTGSLYGACDSTTPPTTTPRIGLAQPVINACGWGATLNTDLSIIDSSSVFLNASNNFTAAQTFTSSVTISTLTVTNNATINGQTIVKSIRFPDGTVQVSSAPSGGVGSFSGINASGSPILASSATLLGGTNVTLSQSGSTITINSISSGGGASSLAVQRNAVNISSPTVAINFLGPPFNVALVNAGTSQVTLDGSSVTLLGQNVIDLTSSLQTGATFYVSSGTVYGPFYINSPANTTILNPTQVRINSIYGAGLSTGQGDALQIDNTYAGPGFYGTSQSFSYKGTDQIFQGWISSSTYDGGNGKGAWVIEGGGPSSGSTPILVGTSGSVTSGHSKTFLGIGAQATNAQFEVTPDVGHAVPTEVVHGNASSNNIEEWWKSGAGSATSLINSSGVFVAPGVSVSTITASSVTIQNITINGTCTGSGCGSGSGIVSPGTFTWTNPNGIGVSTIAVQMTTPTLVSNFQGTNLGSAGWILVKQHYAYVSALSGNSLTVFDVANPTAPVQISQTSTTASGTLFGAEGIDIAGKYLFEVSLNTSTFNVFDISSPANVILSTSIADTTRLNGAEAVRIYGNYAYVANFSSVAGTQPGITVVDISNPLAPKIVGSLTNSNIVGPIYIEIRYPYLYVTNEDASCKLNIIDISNPIVPVLKTSFVPSGCNSNILGEDFNGRYMYLSGQGNFSIYTVDISSPLAPVSVSTTSTGAYGPGVLRVYGNKLYTDARLPDGLLEFDLTNPASPVWVSTITSASAVNRPDDIYANGQYLYVTNHGNGGSTAGFSIFNTGSSYLSALQAGSAQFDQAEVTHDLRVNRAIVDTSLSAPTIGANSLSVSTLTLPSLLGQSCLGTNSSGTVQAGTCGGGSGSGIVSPGTFTWTNGFGVNLSTVQVSSNSIIGVTTFYADGTEIAGAGTRKIYNGAVGIGKVPGLGNGSLDVAITINSDVQMQSPQFNAGSGGFTQGTKVIPALNMNSTGSNFGCVENTGGQVWDLGSCPSQTALGTPILKWTGTNQVIGPSASFVATPSSITFNSNIQVSSGMLLSGAAGTSGQFLTSGGAGTVPTWTTAAGGGGASTLAVQKNAVNISSPTVAINFLGPPFLVSLVNSSTAQIGLDGSSVTLQGTNVINLTSSLQPGSTFYVSSGTVAGQLTANSINTSGAGGLTVLNGSVSGAIANNINTLEAFFTSNNFGDTTNSEAIVGDSNCTGTPGSCQKSVGLLGEATGTVQSTGTAYGVFGTALATGGTNIGLYGHANGGTSNHAVLIDSGDFVSSGTAGTSGQVLTSNGAGLMAEWKTASGGSGSGIVSPGTFTWTNNFGMSGSTLALVNASSAFTFTASSSSTGINLVSISSSPAVNANDFLLTVSSVAGTVAFGIQNNSHIVSSGTTPSVTTCGTLPSMDPNSTDFAGTINTGSGSPTACTLTFASPFANTPVCVVSDDLQTSEPAVTTRSATAITMTLGASLSSGHIFFICVGQKG